MTLRPHVQLAGMLLLVWAACAGLYVLSTAILGSAFTRPAMRGAAGIEAIFLSGLLILCRRDARKGACVLMVALIVGAGTGILLAAMFFSQPMNWPLENEAFLVLTGGLVGMLFGLTVWWEYLRTPATSKSRPTPEASSPAVAGTRVQSIS